MQDSNGILWVARRNGLDRVDPASGRFTRYRHDPNDVDTPASNDVRFVLEDRQSMLWLAMRLEASIKFDRQRGQFTRYDRQDAQHPGSAAKEGR